MVKIIYLVAVLGWQKTRENADDITATLAALSTKIDMSVLYRGLDPDHIHNLVSVVGVPYNTFKYRENFMQTLPFFTQCDLLPSYDLSPLFLLSLTLMLCHPLLLSGFLSSDNLLIIQL